MLKMDLTRFLFCVICLFLVFVQMVIVGLEVNFDKRIVVAAWLQEIMGKFLTSFKKRLFC